MRSIYIIILFAFRLTVGDVVVVAQSNPMVGEARGFDPEATFTPMQIREDIAAIARAFEEVHPSLHRHITREQLDRLFAGTMKSVTHPLTYAEFVRRITPLVTALRCAHTIILPSDSYEAFARSTQKSFPFGVKLIGGKLYVLRNYSGNSSISPGSEIEKINGAAVKDILPTLLSAYSNDGANTTSAMRWMDGDGFGSMYALHIGTPDTFALTLRYRGRRFKRALVPALTAASIQAHRVRRYGDSVPRLLSLALDRNTSTALLTLRSFHRPLLESQGFRFESFIDSAFREIESHNITNLILDIRNNRGGATRFGAILYSYLGTDSAFRYIDGVEMTRSTPPSFNPGMPWGESSDFSRLEEGRFSLHTHPDLVPMRSKPNRFKGSLHVVIDGGTFSSAGIFAAYLHAHRNARFIGEESGSDYHSINGYPVQLTLPNSGVKILVPAQRYLYNTGIAPGKSGRGVMPDFPFASTIVDIVSGNDRELAFVKNLIAVEGRK